MAHTRKRSRDHSITGGMHLKLIPAKDGALQVHHPMVSLTFHMNGGDELIIFAAESEHAQAIFDHLKQALTPTPSDHPGHFIRNLYIPSFS